MTALLVDDGPRDRVPRTEFRGYTGTQLSRVLQEQMQQRCGTLAALTTCAPSPLVDSRHPAPSIREELAARRQADASAERLEATRAVQLRKQQAFAFASAEEERLRREKASAEDLRAQQSEQAAAEAARAAVRLAHPSVGRSFGGLRSISHRRIDPLFAGPPRSLRNRVGGGRSGKLLFPLSEKSETELIRRRRRDRQQPSIMSACDVYVTTTTDRCRRRRDAAWPGGPRCVTATCVGRRSYIQSYRRRGPEDVLVDRRRRPRYSDAERTPADARRGSGSHPSALAV